MTSEEHSIEARSRSGQWQILEKQISRDIASGALAPGSRLPTETEIMDQFKVPGVDMPAIIEARRKDIEALVAANKAAFESMKARGSTQRAILSGRRDGR